MTEPPGRTVRPAAPDVVPPEDDFHAIPVPSAAPETRGMLRFAGVVLALVGLAHVVAGVVALTESRRLLARTTALPVHVGYTTWGWGHLVLGVLALGAGVGVLMGNRLASVVAVVLAMVSAVVNLVFLKAEPGWALVMIALDVLVIWGVTAHAPPPRPAR
jgi:uncharacterized protein YybS (DUF2232 family)